MNSTGDLNGPDLNPTAVLVIVGPTAVGKSAVAVAVASQLGGEIIALDSRQIYRFMPIGTDQPEKKGQGRIPHHLYGIREPDKSISSGEYARLVEQKINVIFQKGNHPILCGGSGLYFKAVTEGLFEGSTSDPTIRQRLKEDLKEKGADALLRKLMKIDPEYARIVHPNNHKRLLRALEIHEITGIPPSEHFKKQKGKSSLYRFFSAYLRASIEHLEGWIGERTRKMIEAGWVDEVKSLLKLGYSGLAHPMDSLGYRQIMDYLEGKVDFDEMVTLINIETRQYARKQLKWFDRERVDIRIDVFDKNRIELSTEKIVEKFTRFILT